MASGSYKLNPAPIFLLSDGRIVCGFWKPAQLGFHWERDGRKYDKAFVFEWQGTVDYWPPDEVDQVEPMICGECGKVGRIGIVDDFICLECRGVKIDGGNQRGSVPERPIRHYEGTETP